MKTETFAGDGPLYKKADVVVCGGGPAGIMAAVAAARNGARTLLVERYGFLGGMATAAMIGPICKFRLGGAFIVRGLPWEFMERMAADGGAITTLPSGSVPFDVEVYMDHALRLVGQAGAGTLLHAFVSEAVAETGNAGRIDRIIVDTKQGRLGIEGTVFIDCTGTGDLIAWTDLPWHMRQSETGSLQPLSLMFHLGGVDTAHRTLLMADDGTQYRDTVLANHLREALEAGQIGDFGGPWALWGSVVRKGYVSVLATRFAGNAVDATNLTQAELALRKDIPQIVRILRAKASAFRNCYLARTATQAGIRETRAIEGLYTMTAHDVMTPSRFEDSIAKGGHPVDIHIAGSKGGQTVHFIEQPYDIPYRTLVPKGAANVLAAGGCIAADRQAFATLRVQAQCMAMGQAAGTAAALSCAAGCSVAQLDTHRLQSTLVEQGAII